MVSEDQRDQHDRADRDLDELDDDLDREELRRRYYGLLQELRVVLPGVQVLLAFLLTVPFDSRFQDLDATGRALFAIALVSALLSVVCLVSPSVVHRLAERTARRARLRLGIIFELIGLGLLGLSLAASLWCVTRLVYGSTTAALITLPVIAAIIVVWVVIPLAVRATYRS
jgi:MFS family permease